MVCFSLNRPDKIVLSCTANGTECVPCVVLWSIADLKFVFLMQRILPPYGHYLEAEGNHSQQRSLAL